MFLFLYTSDAFLNKKMLFCLLFYSISRVLKNRIFFITIKPLQQSYNIKTCKIAYFVKINQTRNYLTVSYTLSSVIQLPNILNRITKMKSLLNSDDIISKWNLQFVLSLYLLQRKPSNDNFENLGSNSPSWPHSRKLAEVVI